MRDNAAKFVCFELFYIPFSVLMWIQIDIHAFRMPQLSVLTEMEYPALWIPIPHMRGVGSLLVHLAFMSLTTVTRASQYI